MLNQAIQHLQGGQILYHVNSDPLVLSSTYWYRVRVERKTDAKLEGIDIKWVTEKSHFLLGNWEATTLRKDLQFIYLFFLLVSTLRYTVPVQTSFSLLRLPLHFTDRYSNRSLCSVHWQLYRSWSRAISSMKAISSYYQKKGYHSKCWLLAGDCFNFLNTSLIKIW